MIKYILKAPRNVIDAYYLHVSGHKASDHDIKMIKLMAFIGGPILGIIAITIDLILSS